MTRALCGVLILSFLVLAVTPAVHAQTTEADVYVGQAVIDFSDKHYEAALANLRRALEVQPDHLEALYYMGLTQLALGHPQEAAQYLERARQRAQSDPNVAYQLGLAYFAQQDYARAQPLLEQAFRQDPTTDSLGYYVGFMRYRNKDYQGALKAFRTGRSSDPNVQQLTRFYTALALAVLGLPAQAASEVEEALRLQPSSPLTGPAERLRDTIVAARQRERRFSAELRVGGFYDDNVAVVPSGGVDPVVAALRHRDHDSFGELFGARAEYVWLRTNGLDATIGYSFFGTHNNDLPEFDIMDHLATLGLNWSTALGTMPAQLGLQYAFDWLALDGDEFVRRHTATLVGALAESEMNLSQVFLRYQRKDFVEIAGLPRAEVRDANNYTLGALHLFRFAHDKHFIKVGYQLDYDDTEGRNYEYIGHRGLLGGQLTLPWQAIRLKYDLDVHYRDYQNRNTIFPTTNPGSKERSDVEITNVFRGELPLPYGFTVSAEYQLTINKSNLDVFDYTRNLVSVIVSWSY